MQRGENDHGAGLGAGRAATYVLGLALIALAAVGGVTAEPVARRIDGFVAAGTFGGSNYYVSDTEMTWHEALAACAAAGGHLVTVAGVAENQLVLEATDLQGGANVWLGFTDEAAEGVWVWVDGTPVAYTNWADYGDATEPDNAGGIEHYAQMWGSGFADAGNRGAWADVAGHVHNFAVLELPVGEGVDPPAEVVAETLGPAAIQLSWSAGDPQPEAIEVERKEGLTGAWELVQTLSGDAVSWIDDTVVAGVDYYYRLRADDGAQLSGPSNCTTAIPGVLPAAPTDLVAQAPSPYTITLSWQDNATNELGYLLERKAGEFGTWQDYSTRPAGETSFADYNAYPEEDFRYRVRAYNVAGKSAYATSNVAWTPADTTDFDAGVYVVNGLTPCVWAEVFVDRDDGNGWVSAGLTDGAGYIFLEHLGFNDRLRAVWMAKYWENCRDYQDDSLYGMGLRLFLDSDVGPDQFGQYAPYRITSEQAAYTLDVQHPIYAYDLAMSIGRDLAAGDPYWSQMHDACQQASDYLYDVSDGQIAFGRIQLYDNWGRWGDVDVQVQQGNFTAHANTGQYDDCDSASKQEHIFMPGASGPAPNTTGFPRTLVHEFGHYALNLKDEYENGKGNQGFFAALRMGNAQIYPANYGFMDNQAGSSEMSSKNDYLANYDYDCGSFCAHFVTEQLHCRGISCWDYVEGMLEGFSSLADITVPPYGTYLNGRSTSNDRAVPLGGWDDVRFQDVPGGSAPAFRRPGPPVSMEVFDSGSGPTAFVTDVVLRDGEGPAASAGVYRLGSRGLERIGRTDDAGWLRGVAVAPGDEVRAYFRGPGRTVRVRSPQVSRAASIQLAVPRRAAKAARDACAPGAAADVRIHGAVSEPLLELRLWLDEPLATAPEVVAYHGSHADDVPAAWEPDTGRWVCELALDVDDPLYDGMGVFEITVCDTADNVSVFTTDFAVRDATAGEHLEIYQGSAGLNVPAEAVAADLQPTVGSACNAWPHGAAASGLIPVSDLYGFHLAEDDQFGLLTGVNVQYADSLLAGVDETTLGLYRWDETSRSWALADSSVVSPEWNVVSGLVSSGGLHAVFATALSGDVTPPGAIEDLGAVGVEGSGCVQLFWTAPGDDGEAGVVQQYVVGFATEPFGPESWSAMDRLTVPVTVEPAGVEQTAKIQLPREGRLYYLAMRAKDDASLLGPLSNVTYAVAGSADANLLPAPPTAMRAVDVPDDAGGAVAVTWQISADDGAGKGTVEAYHVYRAGPDQPAPELVATVPPGSSAWTDVEAVPAVPFTYVVSAADSIQQAMSREEGAFSAINQAMPIGDLTSDGIVGLDDLGRLVDAYGTAAADLEYDPLFDLDADGEVHHPDVDVFAAHYGEGGLPASDPPGENDGAELSLVVTQPAADLWHVDLTVSGASNLAGYGFRVMHDVEAGHLVDAGPGDGGDDPGFLGRHEGERPVFMIAEPAPGTLWIGEAIQAPSTWSSPEGSGVLAHLVFAADSHPGIAVDDVVLIDHAGGLNDKGAPVSVGEGPPRRTVLHQNYPNPFNPGTTLRFETAARGHVTLSIHDLRGLLVRRLVDATLPAGRHEVVWDGRSDRGAPAASGVYLYRLDAPDRQTSRKMVLLR